MLVAALLVVALGSPAVIETPADVQRANLEAFARLYGYVRFFHPSDEASRVDWNRFAVYGGWRVRLAETPEELSATLRELFQPIAPAMRIHLAGGGPDGALAPGGLPDLWPDEPDEPDKDAQGELGVVAWQHRGVGLGGRGPYDSIRTHRLRRHPARSNGYGRLMQSISAEPYRGKRVRLKAAVKTNRAPGSGSGQAHLWLRADGGGARRGPDVVTFGQGFDLPVASEVWAPVELEAEVSASAAFITVGGVLRGEGVVWLDDVALEVEIGEDVARSWQRIPLENGGFESKAGLTGWLARDRGYFYGVEKDEPFAGEQSAVLEVEYLMSPPKLFAATPEVGEVTFRTLPRGIEVEIPLALLGDEERTYGGEADETATERLLESLRTFDVGGGDDLASRLGAVVVAWNVFQHFYPYFDEVDVDWESLLAPALEATLEAPDDAAFSGVLRRLAARLADGHANLYHPRLDARRSRLPLAVDWIEEHLVVTRSEASGIERGDVILTVDGRPAAEDFLAARALVSGSPQWKRQVAARDFGFGDEGESVTLELERSGERFSRALVRDRPSILSEERPESFTELEESVFYIDLTETPMAQIQERMELLAEARGLILDVRGYPRGNHDLLRHLTDEPLYSPKWLVPQTIYPDRENLAGYDHAARWMLTPRTPRIEAKVVFLTNAAAISYAESIMGIVEHYRLGEIVGEPTAGCNGNVNTLSLPGGYRLTFTGMKVVKHDDSQHHLVGILPTVPVERTLAAVRDGRDQYIERALALLPR